MLRGAALPALVAVTAVAFDQADRHTPFSVLVTGLLDEPAHVAFAALALWVLALLVPLPRGLWVSALLTAAVIDLDHLPLYFGMSAFAAQPGGRPVSHSLATVVVLAVLAAVWRRRSALLLGASLGVFLHLVRDVVEGPPGVALLWPFSDHEWSMSGATFVLLVAGLLLARVALLAFSARLMRGPEAVVSPQGGVSSP